MKKTLIFLMTILCAFTLYLSLSTNDVVIVEAVAPNGYYSGTENLSGNALLNKLAAITKTNHKTYTSYDDIRDSAKGNPSSDKDPNNSNNLLDFYTKISISSAWDGGNTWNREHVWPQSLSGGLFGKSGAGADVHHIRPTISSINSSRGNKLFTDFDLIKATGTAKYHDGVLAAYQNSNYWEPIDDVKGDTARIIMYLYMHYSKEVTENQSYSYAGNLKITNVIYSDDGEDGAWDLLVYWNDLDPVDKFESDRNEFCSNVTGTRNPFIDNPEFAERIWGDGEGPEIPKTYKVSYNVGNATFNYTDNKEYESGSKVTAPTTNPYLEGYTFEGWYTSNSYTTKWDFSTNTITSNMTLYAKFSKNESKTFDEIFKTLNIKSQLTFDVEETIDSFVSIPETKTVTINQITAGEGSFNAGGEYDLADYMTFDTNLFDIKINSNGAEHTYIKAGAQIRLYPSSGNGSSINITAKEGVKITDVKVVLASDNAATPTITVNADGSSAMIKNTVNATSKNQVRLTGFTITYEIGGSGEKVIYNLTPNSLYLNYVLQLSKSAYAKYLEDDKEIELYIDGAKAEYDVIEFANEYRLIYRIHVSDYTKVYKPTFKYGNLEITLNGYSAKTLASYYLSNLPNDTLVKQYKDCLTEIKG